MVMEYTIWISLVYWSGLYMKKKCECERGWRKNRMNAPKVKIYLPKCEMENGKSKFKSVCVIVLNKYSECTRKEKEKSREVKREQVF